MRARAAIALLALFLCAFLCSVHAQTQTVIPTLNPALPRIRFGRTTTFTPGSPQTVYGVRLDAAYRLWQDLVNTNGGILVNGTTYMVEQIVYNDGADCNTMLILYERLITVDKVNFLFAPTGYDCQRLALLAERYQIPYMNGADGSMQATTETDPAYKNLKWTFTTFPNLPSLINCYYSLQAAGMRTFVMAFTPDVPGFDTAVIAATNALNGTIRMLSNDVISLPTLAAAGAAGKLNGDGAPLACDYFNSLIDKWISLDPDVWLGTASTYNFDLLVCMHRRGYHPRAGMWNFIAIGPATPADAWHYNGLLTQNGWDPYANFADSIFTNTQVFAQQIQLRYNFTALSYEAQMAVTGTMIVEVIKRTQSLDPFVIRDALVNYQGSTVANVDTHFIPGTQQTAQSRICFQAISANTTVATWPRDYANARNISYPWKFVYDQSFLDSLRRATRH
jgi:branched-chain amino acid transport system substrate-binding protein